MTIDVRQAKAHFVELLKRAVTGEKIIITKAGRPIAKLVPIRKKAQDRLPGSAKGKFEMADNFNAPLPKEIEDSFWQ